jgi:hypothetical protein
MDLQKKILVELEADATTEETKTTIGGARGTSCF